MRADPRALLWDALRSADAILGFLAGKTLADYHADLMLRSAVERQFEIIGEALGKLARIAPDVASRIPQVSEAVAFRNRQIHGYDMVDGRVVWRTVVEHLPALRRDVAAVLDNLGR